MSDVIIKVENLTKTFKLYDHPKDRLKEALNPFRKKYHHEYHALKDISFSIKRGESVGILGKNGAGKSTLLKILTGVLVPTSGEVKVNGRISALLELGSGFNPELSGLENIYFQGAIMGFSKEEMESKVPAIIEFADIGNFINQPVKLYSSGMFARLAFSVAISMDPDILIVDEVLGVGDVRFQAKCLRRIDELRENGCSILFVSHSSAQVESICQRVIWIDSSQVKEDGEAKALVRRYLNFMAHGLDKVIMDSKEVFSNSSCIDEEEWVYISNSQKTRKDEDVDITKVRVMKNEGTLAKTLVSTSEKILVEFEVRSSKTIVKPLIALGVMNSLNEPIIHFNTQNSLITIETIYPLEVLNFQISFTMPPLRPGEYFIALGLDEGIPTANELLVHVYDAWPFHVVSKDPLTEQSGYIQISDVSIKFKVIKERALK